MKCDENGHCPFGEWGGSQGDEDYWFGCHLGYHEGEGFDATLIRDNCHLNPTDIPLLKAMISGEWSCDKCREQGFCYDIPTPCKRWKPKEVSDECM